jgi:oligopeptide transport system permease protein
MEITTILKDRIPVSMFLARSLWDWHFFWEYRWERSMANHKGRLPDHIGTVFIVLVNAVPAVVYYLFIQMYFTSLFGLPILFQRGNPVSFILPIISLALGNIAYYGMWVRRYMIDESSKDYVKLAVAKGCKSKDIMSKQIFRNAFVPLRSI